MAEPVDRRAKPLHVNREFSVCRMETELRIQVYGLLVPVIREFVGPSVSRPVGGTLSPMHIPSHKGGA